MVVAIDDMWKLAKVWAPKFGMAEDNLTLVLYRMTSELCRYEVRLVR
jgi:hypothetical protein